jgi:hypothetical protein
MVDTMADSLKHIGAAAERIAAARDAHKERAHNLHCAVLRAMEAGVSDEARKILIDAHEADLAEQDVISGYKGEAA